MGRFKLMGYLVEGHEENPDVLTAEQQRIAASDLTIVHETDSADEALTIRRAGGFFKDRDHFYYVGKVLDTEVGEAIHKDQVAEPVDLKVDLSGPAIDPFPQKGS